MIRDNPETNPIPIKPETVSHAHGGAVLLGPSPCCPTPGSPFPIKPLALSARVCPQTWHFGVVDKSPHSGAPSCNTSTARWEKRHASIHPDPSSKVSATSAYCTPGRASRQGAITRCWWLFINPGGPGSQACLSHPRNRYPTTEGLLRENPSTLGAGLDTDLCPTLPAGAGDLCCWGLCQAVAAPNHPLHLISQQDLGHQHRACRGFALGIVPALSSENREIQACLQLALCCVLALTEPGSVLRALYGLTLIPHTDS